MKALSRFQAFLKSVPARIVGSYVELHSEQPTRLSSWAHFPADERLQLRLKAARDLIGDRPVKADRKAIGDWARDGNGSPVDYEDLPV